MQGLARRASYAAGRVSDFQARFGEHSCRRATLSASRQRGGRSRSGAISSIGACICGGGLPGIQHLGADLGCLAVRAFNGRYARRVDRLHKACFRHRVDGRGLAVGDGLARCAPTRSVAPSPSALGRRPHTHLAFRALRLDGRFPHSAVSRCDLAHRRNARGIARTRRGRLKQLRRSELRRKLETPGNTVFRFRRNGSTMRESAG